jgi:hypothetical protein
MIITTKYDWCDKAYKTSYTCVNAKPVTRKNGEIIQIGISKRPGKCLRCLS